MSLTRLVLHNFRSHHHISIHLDPGVNVIVGDNGSGKSNLLRSLRWLATNRPMGNSVRRRAKDAGETKVTLHVDGKRISRTKSDNRNDYTIDGEKLSAPKASVPAPVAQLLSMDESNFSMHWRGPAFWFGLTAGEVAKELNRIVNLDLIDRSLGNIASKVRGLRAEKKVCKERLRAAQEQLVKVANTPQLVQDFATLRKRYNRVQVLSDVRRKLVQMIEDRQRLIAERDRASQCSLELKRLVQVAGWSVKTSAALAKISEQVSNVGRLRSDIAEAECRAKEMHDKLYKQLEGRCPLCRQPWDKV